MEPVAIYNKDKYQPRLFLNNKNNFKKIQLKTFLIIRNVFLVNRSWNLSTFMVSLNVKKSGQVGTIAARKEKSTWVVVGHFDLSTHTTTTKS